ncbi:MAG: hypothetical protein V2I33_22200 [Kangiellaceae bacterium]|jgi:hypothetical protein|nr:hypothetical protein [Kangiellaceae bacterium]
MSRVESEGHKDTVALAAEKLNRLSSAERKEPLSSNRKTSESVSTVSDTPTNEQHQPTVVKQ